MTDRLTEFAAEATAFAWLASLGWTVRWGPEIALDEPLAEQQGYGQVVLEQRLRDTLRPKLISGELRVPDVEKILEDAEI
ncbi:hypothetical protein [Rhodothermus marinus]|uniref:hypothetical protein n=1 Tax=Rhodothermus marinus TaxID=29549 RepID=UPI0002F1F154|nr:hypothetical protein [Rhodothermus marinus]